MNNKCWGNKACSYYWQRYIFCRTTEIKKCKQTVKVKYTFFHSSITWYPHSYYSIFKPAHKFCFLRSKLSWYCMHICKCLIFHIQTNKTEMFPPVNMNNKWKSLKQCISIGLWKEDLQALFLPGLYMDSLHTGSQFCVDMVRREKEEQMEQLAVFFNSLHKLKVYHVTSIISS